MSNKSVRYSVGDIIQHNIEHSVKREILYVFSAFYDETGYSKEIYYQTKILGNQDVPPTAIRESAIDKYYTVIYYESK